MKKNYNANHSSGFTLLEILVVMVILGVLVAIGLRTFSTSQMRARDARRKRNLEQIANALELYRSDKGHYPVSDEGEIKVFYDDEGVVTPKVFSWGDTFYDLENEGNIYMGNLPKDPSGLRYNYLALDNLGVELVDGVQQAQAYRIYAYLENEQDSDRIETLPDGSSNLPDGDVYCHPEGSSFLCNYFISTPNLSN